MTAAHTPGPWETANWGVQYYSPVGDEDDLPITIVMDKWVIAVAVPDLVPEVAANARLIAAAPELLDATMQALALIDDMAKFVGLMALADYGLFNAAPIALRAAIAKATGGAA